MSKLQEMKAFVKLIQSVNTINVKPLISLVHGYTDKTVTKQDLDLLESTNSKSVDTSTLNPLKFYK